MGTYGTAPPPRRVAPLVTPGATDPRSVQARSESKLHFCQTNTDILVGRNEQCVGGVSQGKMSNKPDEAWIMNRLIKQLTDMGFPVQTLTNTCMMFGGFPFNLIFFNLKR